MVGAPPAAEPGAGIPDWSPWSTATRRRHRPARAAERRTWRLGAVDAELDAAPSTRRRSSAVRAAIARGDVYQVNVVGHAQRPVRR